MDKNKVLNDIYNDAIENIYLSINIINNDKLKDFEKDLLDLDEYLPNLLRRRIDLKYYSLLLDKKNIKDIISKMNETRRYSYEEEVVEFINWIDAHEKFKDILLEKRIIKLGNLLEDLEKDYKKLKENL